MEPSQLLKELIIIEKNYGLPFKAFRSNIHLIEATINIKAYAVKHKLRLTDSTPIYTKNYRRHPTQNQIGELLHKGIILKKAYPPGQVQYT